MQYTVRLSACRTCSGVVCFTSLRRVNITSYTNSTTHVRDNLPIDARSIGRVYSELLHRHRQQQRLQHEHSTSASAHGLTAAACRVCAPHRPSFSSSSPTLSSTSGYIIIHEWLGEIIDETYMYKYEFILHQIHVLEYTSPTSTWSPSESGYNLNEIFSGLSQGVGGLYM